MAALSLYEIRIVLVSDLETAELALDAVGKLFDDEMGPDYYGAVLFNGVSPDGTDAQFALSGLNEEGETFTDHTNTGMYVNEEGEMVAAVNSRTGSEILESMLGKVDVLLERIEGGECCETCEGEALVTSEYGQECSCE